MFFQKIIYSVLMNQNNDKLAVISKFQVNIDLTYKFYCLLPTKTDQIFSLFKYRNFYWPKCSIYRSWPNNWRMLNIKLYARNTFCMP